MRYLKLYEEYTKDEWITKYKLPSDNIRFYYIQKALYEPKEEKVDIKKLTDTWDGYDDLVFTENDGNDIIFYEGFVKSCWDSLFMKDEYNGLSKEEAVQKMIDERFTRISNDLGLNLKEYSFDGKILKIVFNKKTHLMGKEYIKILKKIINRQLDTMDIESIDNMEIVDIEFRDGFRSNRIMVDISPTLKYAERRVVWPQVYYMIRDTIESIGLNSDEWDVLPEFKYPESDKHPFEETVVGESRIRTFNKDVLTEELVWHRDKEDRLVEIIEGNGWELQLDDKLPVKMNNGDRFIIPEGVYHRVKRGIDKLVIKITRL